MRTEYGAYFKTANLSRDLLQAFYRGRTYLLKDLQSKLQALNQGYYTFSEHPRLLERTMITLDEVEFILRHKATQRHLPQPMIHLQDLYHHYCKPRRSCLICENEGTGSDVFEATESITCEECEREEADSDSEIDLH